MPLFPFSAIVGQEEMKLALLLAAVSREVCGVLICGEKGSGKSTAARALAALLPEIGPQKQAPFVNLPLNATEEALYGTVDLEKTLALGQPVYDPGLLSRAHQGVLYIDEVNLLPDHLVAGLLDVAENSRLVIEREGFSLEYPASFVLIGSMNPEEGELSSQFLDRFGLCVLVSGEKDPEIRVEIIKRCLDFERDPKAFLSRYEKAEEELKTRLRQAQALYPRVTIPSALLVLIGELAREAQVSGHRADLVLSAAARAHAALYRRELVEEQDLEAVVEMVLRHRRRDLSPPKKTKTTQHKETAPEKSVECNTQTPSQEDSAPPPPPPETSDEPLENTSPQGEEERPPQGPPEEVPPHEGRDQVFEIGEVFALRPLELRPRRSPRQGPSGKRYKAPHQRGRFVRAIIPRGRVQDVALSATLRAAAPYQRVRGGGPGQGFIVTPQDLREKLRQGRSGQLLLFCVDASGSMAAEARMRETKGAIISLLLNAYQKRDRVALIVFRGKEAQLVLPPTNSVERAGKLLRYLPVGGSTPLPAALSFTAEFLASYLRREPETRVTTFFITDGRGNVSLGTGKPQEEIKYLARELRQRFAQVEFVVVDTETGLIRLDMAKELAQTLSARYFTPEALKAEHLAQIARDLIRNHEEVL